ncbi:HolA DNA polymerase III subunit delta [Streptococcus phage Dp-1]|uniref:clamp loader of DNA polymerase n=1 Tax=Pneumococcus phage Dp-1 TaxID=59241 RepID=UPI0001F3E624|nr:clamp loader of DNA polymerase [Streptococcus phage Dp-1]ADT64026.1 HolA DNA polymerase III subunit delta [Streptococcus phage Dp-1]
MSDLVSFQKDIRTNNLKPFYILYGEEIGLMNVYLNQMGNVVRETSVSTVWKTLTQKGLVSNHRIFAVRDDKEFLSNESRWKRLPDVRYGTLVLMVTKIDKRSKLLKAFPDNCVEFEKMTDAQLKRHFVSKYSTIDSDMIDMVIQFCLNDYSRIDNELDKLSRLKKVDASVVESIVKHKTEIDIFSLVDDVLEYRPEQAIMKVTELLAKGESPIGLLTLLYQNFNNACLVLGADEPKEANLGIKQFLINKIVYNFQYELDSAFEGMAILGQAIEGIKNGRYTESSVVYISLYKIFSLT